MTAEALQSILEYDQLNRERILGRAFQGFSEGKIQFLPTFKYDKGSDLYDTSTKMRPPAWTDRVLYNLAVRSPQSEKINEEINEEEEETELGKRRSKRKGSKIKSKKDKKIRKLEKQADSISDASTNTDISTDSTDCVTTASSTDTIKGAEWQPQLILNKYYSIDSRHSDHRPVCAEFTYKP